MNNLHDSVERWLVQDGHSVIETKTDDNFKIIIKNIQQNYYPQSGPLARWLL